MDFGGSCDIELARNNRTELEEKISHRGHRVHRDETFKLILSLCTRCPLWLIALDRLCPSSAAFVKVVLKDYKEACIGYFVTGIDSGTLTIILSDFYGRRRLVYSGDGEAQQWIVDRLHKAGLKIARE